MRILNTLSAILRGGTTSLNQFERSILAAIVAKIEDPAQREGLQRQIDAVNFVQRLDGGREVNCYYRGENQVVADNARLDGSVGERKVAEVHVTGNDLATNRCSVWTVDGRLFSLEFDKSTEHAFPEDVKSFLVRLL